MGTIELVMTNKNCIFPNVSLFVSFLLSFQVKEGDIVTMCSATFGNEMWSTRGVGLARVLAAIRVRSGPTVSLVFESPNQYKKKALTSAKQREAMEEARRAAQEKKDRLLQELEKDEVKLKKGKFLGLF